MILHANDMRQGDHGVLATPAPYGGTMRGAFVPAGTRIRVAWSHYRRTKISTAIEWWSEAEQRWVGPWTLNDDKAVVVVGVERHAGNEVMEEGGSSYDLDPVRRGSLAP